MQISSPPRIEHLNAGHKNRICAACSRILTTRFRNGNTAPLSRHSASSEAPESSPDCVSSSNRRPASPTVLKSSHSLHQP